ncbi:hypothetical protein D3C81_1381280 [compost metagenome]
MLAHAGRARQLDKRLARQRLRRDAALACQRMAGRAHQVEGVAHQRLDAQVVVLRGRRCQRKVGAALPDQFDAAIGQLVEQLQHDARVACAELRQQRRQVAARQRRQRGDRHAALAPLGVRAQVFERRLEIRQQPPRGLLEAHAISAELHVARGALEQPAAGLLLQRLHQRAEGGLGEVARLRRAREIAVRGQRHEGAQVLDRQVRDHGGLDLSTEPID